jgi:predicted nucleic acid-binding protein
LLTRLPTDERVTACDALALFDECFAETAALQRSIADALATCARPGIVGGAVHDAIVALAAIDHGLILLTRDERALPTYAALGVDLEWIPT